MSPDQELSARALLEQWQEYVARCDAQAVAALYHPDAQFWGTIAAHLRDKPEQIQDYFNKFLNRHRMQVDCRELRLRGLRDLVLAAGHYIFRWQDSPESEEIKARVRFTFVLGEHDERWSIYQHHSSMWVFSGL